MIYSVFDLSPAENLKLIGELWDDLSKKSDDIPVPDSHLQELDRRMKRYDEDPSTALPLEDAIKEILRRNGRK